MFILFCADLSLCKTDLGVISFCEIYVYNLKIDLNTVETVYGMLYLDLR